MNKETFFLYCDKCKKYIPKEANKYINNYKKGEKIIHELVVCEHMW